MSLKCYTCGAIFGGSNTSGTALCPDCMVARIKAYAACFPQSQVINTPNKYITNHLFQDEEEEVKPNDSRTAMLSKKIVTPTQAFNEMHLLLSSLVKQYGKKVGNHYVIELNGDTIEDAGFVAEKHRLSCTKDTNTLNYKVYLNFEKDKQP